MALRRNIHFKMYSDVNRRMHDHQNRNRSANQKQEGEVTIDTSKARRSNNNDSGEYVDYTEIK